MNILPLGRTTDIVVQELKGELLIYDLNKNIAFCLNETAAIVYRACVRQTTFAELKSNYKFSDDLIFLTLDELKKYNLLSGGNTYISPLAGTNRREVIKKVGLASMVALPVISGLVAPQASNAASASGTCIPVNECRAQNSIFCLPGCTETLNLLLYNLSGDGTCGGTLITTNQVNCANLQGLPSSTDYRRV